MLLAKIKEKLLNRRNKVEIEDVEIKGDIPASIKALIESLGGLKYGYYIVKYDPDRLEFAGENLPEDYTGVAFAFLDDGFYIFVLENGNEHYSCWLGVNGLEFYGIDGNVTYGTYGASKLNFASLTHSFSELDPTLVQIIENAIDTGTEVACNLQQWKTIRELLDKSLYIKYNGISMIKSFFNGIDCYSFGEDSGEQIAYKMIIEYDSQNHLLSVYIEEL